MRVFDEEMGPLATREEMAEALTLAEAGLTLAEARAFHEMVSKEVN